VGYKLHVSLGIFLEVIHLLSVFMNALNLSLLEYSFSNISGLSNRGILVSVKKKFELLKLNCTNLKESTCTVTSFGGAGGRWDQFPSYCITWAVYTV